MNNFLCLGSFDTFAVVAKLHELAPHTWTGVRERGEINHEMIGLGASTLLRCHAPVTHENWLSDLPVEETPELAEWPSMGALLGAARERIMNHDLGKHYLSGEMARAMVVRLDPGSSIFWHVDDGPYHARTIRFHLPLVTNPGVLMYSRDEVMHLPPGTLWYFNNHVRHSAANWGEFQRLHLIFEMYRKGD